uniref:UTP--glucose-1-phosphate uridylyltransferase n=1 Tax=Guillardia theta TaxID=55529 RepID=A0A7S4UUR8_GUITH|mmetsp:Transcript_9381/g.31383  ORF Transcript_9381/g.31383 Transcript_9381/m.31383 type:complete len:551 (+) Transcript_9381:60-1712(+)
MQGAGAASRSAIVLSALLMSSLLLLSSASTQQCSSPLHLRGGGVMAPLQSIAKRVGAPEGKVDLSYSDVQRLRGGVQIIFDDIRKLMEEEKLSESAIRAFQQAYEALVRGDDGMISERMISPALDLPMLADIKQASIPDDKVKALLGQTVILKLNGGLGTGMGLEKAKSLLEVKGSETFLDFIAKQVLHFRKTKGDVRSMFMNSFSTSADTKDALKGHPELVQGGWEVVQNKVPKIDAESLRPAKWPANPTKEWCPPGHGDLYPSLAGSGMLDSLLKDGVKYMFVSNSDNLGATLDLELLNFFAQSDKSFLMEVCERTEADKKGGHLAVRKQDGRLLLRESAQCPPDDEKAFQDVSKHKYFNTNNLWIRLDKLKEVLDKNNGVVPLPMIKNAKTVDPSDSKSAAVFQLETAMGAAIESFDNSGAIVVDRSRFAPVKTCADLLRVRSDAYDVTEDSRLVLSAECKGQPPVVDLDKKEYKTMSGLDKMLSKGDVPSLKHCKKLTVKGKVALEKGITFKGEVTIVNPTAEWRILKAGVYENQTVELGENSEKL